MQKLCEDLTEVCESVSEAKLKKFMAAEGFFSLYKNLLSAEAQTVWMGIVDEQIRKSPWTDLKGQEHH